METLSNKLSNLSDAVTIHSAKNWFNKLPKEAHQGESCVFIEAIIPLPDYFIRVLIPQHYTEGFVLEPKQGVNPMYVALILNSSHVRNYLKGSRKEKHLNLTPYKLNRIPFVLTSTSTQNILGLVYQCIQVYCTEENSQQDPFHLLKVRIFEDLRDAICHELFEPRLQSVYNFQIINDWTSFLFHNMNIKNFDNVGMTLELANACCNQLMNPQSNLTRNIKHMQYILGESF